MQLVEETHSLGFFVYSAKKELDLKTFQYSYIEDRQRRYSLKLFAEGEQYKLFSLFTTRLHLFGVEQPGTIYLFGTDSLGRDLFSRTIHAFDKYTIKPCHGIYREPARTIPILDEVDVLVVGGSQSGCAAAICAARQGPASSW